MTHPSLTLRMLVTSLKTKPTRGPAWFHGSMVRLITKHKGLGRTMPRTVLPQTIRLTSPSARTHSVRPHCRYHTQNVCCLHSVTLRATSFTTRPLPVASVQKPSSFVGVLLVSTRGYTPRSCSSWNFEQSTFVPHGTQWIATLPVAFHSLYHPSGGYLRSGSRVVKEQALCIYTIHSRDVYL